MTDTSDTSDADSRQPNGDIEVAAPGRPALRATVVNGGVPTPAQTAALAVALSAARTSAPDTAPSRPSDWHWAALRESVGGAAIAERSQLRRPDGVA